MQEQAGDKHGTALLVNIWFRIQFSLHLIKLSFLNLTGEKAAKEKTQIRHLICLRSN